MAERGKPDYAQRFEELALPYLDTIYRSAYYLTRTTVEAEDLTQETYLKAYRAFGDFRGQNIQ